MYNFNFQLKNFLLVLRSNLKKKGRFHPVILIILYQQGIVLHSYRMSCFYKLLYIHYFFSEIHRNRDLLQDYISSNTCLKKIFNVTQSLFFTKCQHDNRRNERENEWFLFDANEKMER